MHDHPITFTSSTDLYVVISKVNDDPHYGEFPCFHEVGKTEGMIAHYSLVDAMIDARIRTQNKALSQPLHFQQISPIRLIERNNGQLEILLTYAFGARDNKLLLENGVLHPIFTRQSFSLKKPYQCSHLQWPDNLHAALDGYFSAADLPAQAQKTRNLHKHAKALNMAARMADMALATMPGTLLVPTIKDTKVVQQNAIYDVRKGAWHFQPIPCVAERSNSHSQTHG